jgi:hypothetical protein
MIKNIRLVGRQDNMVDIMIPDRKGVSAYKIFVAPTLNGAYDLNPATTQLVEILEIKPQQVYISPSLKRQGREKQMGSNRGLSRVVFSINDFAASNPNIPNDDQQFYLRIQEVDMSGTATGYSPILVIPPPEVYFFRKAPMTLVGTAGGSSSSGSLPNNADMNFIIPKYATHVVIKQTSGTLLFSPLESMPFITVGDSLVLFNTATKQFILSGAAGFEIFLSIELGD